MKVFPEDLLYSREHIWVRVDGNIATIGITDYVRKVWGKFYQLNLQKLILM